MATMVACNDEIEAPFVHTQSTTSQIYPLIEATISFEIDSYYQISGGSRAEGPEVANDDEKRIDNFWLFQFDNSGNKMIEPKYYEISDQNDLKAINVEIAKTETSSTIYVVTNTNDSNWATGTNFNSKNDLLNQNIPNRDPLTPALLKEGKGIPMFGMTQVDAITRFTNITIPVARMYAKVKIKYDFSADKDFEMNLESVEINNIPWSSRIESRFTSDEFGASVPYPNEDYWTTRTYGSSPTAGSEDQVKGYKYVIYIPENIQGTTSTTQDQDKDSNLPSGKPLKITLHAKQKDDLGAMSSRVLTVYPGANNYNDFNIKRNCVYRVNVKADYKDNPEPSSNCIVVVPGTTVKFWPYLRTETGGGYYFADYLTPTVEAKKIHHVGIIWQTENAIGDNSAGNLVWIKNEDSTDPEKAKIYVKIKEASQEGNALIAAYNSSNEIVWSWHIWITPNNPGDLSAALDYSTYAWDENGIYPETRIPGYPIMPCNLGAMAFNPDESYSEESIKRTFGLLYQWGRKDPFPTIAPKSTKIDYHFDYNEENVVPIYDNSHAKITELTANENDVYLFSSLSATKVKNNTEFMSTRSIIDYTIAHPTKFICGTMNANIDTEYLYDASYYNNNGDWLPSGKSDNKLWGGLEPNKETQKWLDPQKNSTNIIFDNYGDQKSIFDPCPMGWRVSPPDLWMEFTNTGRNPISKSSFEEVEKQINIGGYPSTFLGGVYLYLNGWKTGQMSWFPTQGSRRVDGRIFRCMQCGNYHNASASLNNVVNCMHVHINSLASNMLQFFNVFEVNNRFYRSKSLAGPIRCVRDTK